jgi:HEAT repeat protein
MRWFQFGPSCWLYSAADWCRDELVGARTGAVGIQFLEPLYRRFRPELTHFLRLRQSIEIVGVAWRRQHISLDLPAVSGPWTISGTDVILDTVTHRRRIIYPKGILAASLALVGLTLACAEFDPEPQIALLKSLHSDVREKAAGKLVIYGEPVVPRLIEESSSDYTRVRFEVARILGRIRDPRATDTLIRLLDDRSFNVAAYAARGLGDLEAKQALPTLLRFTDTPARIFRQQVVWALGRCYGDTAHAGLRDSVQHVVERALHDPTPDVRVAALQSARQLGYIGMIEQLLRLARDQSAEVRHVAVQALGQVASGDTPRLSDSLTEQQLKATVDVLLGSLQESHQSIRTKAVRALEAIGAPETAETALRRLLARGTTEDQREARRVLEALTEPQMGT